MANTEMSMLTYYYTGSYFKGIYWSIILIEHKTTNGTSKFVRSGIPSTAISDFLPNQISAEETKSNSNATEGGNLFPIAGGHL